jgi:hypothetical protein
MTGLNSQQFIRWQETIASDPALVVLAAGAIAQVLALGAADQAMVAVGQDWVVVDNFKAIRFRLPQP